jgi:membrane-bound serine protease (ClpP class)
MKKIRFIGVIFFIVISVNLYAENRFAVLELSGSVNPIVAQYLAEAIEKATAEGNQFIIIQMDTPGGLMDSMREIIKSILTSKIPVVVYTYPKGAQAASAGGFIMLASHVAAMAPGTEIGAMHPVSPMLDFMKKDRQGDPEGVMEKKVLMIQLLMLGVLHRKEGGMKSGQ